METVTISAFDRSYQINNPGVGRVGSKLVNREPYEKKLLVDIYQQGFAGSAFDVGAHIGNHTLYLAAVCGLTVHAFEPHRPSLDQLYDNLALNPELDVTVHEWAAGDTETRGRLTSGMWIEFDPSRDGAALKTGRGHIPVHRIDDMLDIADLSVVKVDVEGMEAAVLLGMHSHLERSRPTVYTEAHTRAASGKVGEVLRPLGYKITRKIQMGSMMERWQWVSR